MKIFNVGNKEINLYLLDNKKYRLLIDAGFSGQLNEIGRAMRKTGYKIWEIDFLLVTHFHVDHAGEVQALKNQGIKFLIIDTQPMFIEPMEKLIRSKWLNYTPLNRSDNIEVTCSGSRDLLKQININGEIISTPGHSDDSISLLLDSGETFTGDLPAEYLVLDKHTKAAQSWTVLKKKGAKIIYPAHGNKYEVHN